MSSFLKYFRKNTATESTHNNNNVINNLKNSDDAKMLTLENEIKVGYVVDVYDGDTCKINMYFKDDIYKWYPTLGNLKYCLPLLPQHV